MAVYQLKTYADIVSAVREEIGAQASDATVITRIKRDINMIYQEVVAKGRWHWLQGFCSPSLPAYINVGSAAVVAGSASVTLSSVTAAGSFAGFKFAVDGYSEIYTIESHTAGATTLKLDTEFTGASNPTSTYKIWTDKIVLPQDCQDVSMVWHDHQDIPMERMGIRDLRRHQTMAPRAEGKPEKFAVGDYASPTQTSAIASLPALSTRKSSGVLKSLVFASAIPTAVVTKINNGEAVRWRISGAGHYSYNGDMVIASLSTTNVANDTISYIGNTALTEAATADSTISIVSLDSEKALGRYREMSVWPAVNSARVTLHVDYIKDAPALENDTDEPVLPLIDRIVLVYGALSRAWVKVGRNPDEGARNERLFQTKLAQMEGKLQDTLDKPRLSPSRSYLTAKRSGSRGGSGFGASFPSMGGGSGSGAVVAGTPNKVAIYDSMGNIGSAGVSSTTLGYLDATSSVQGQIDAINTLANGKIYLGNGSNVATEVTPTGDVVMDNAGVTAISSGVIVNSDINAGAAIAVNKLAALTATKVMTTDGSGFASTSTVTPTELTYLTDTVPTTSVSLADNTSSATTAITYSASSFPFSLIDYSLTRGSGQREAGTLTLATDGTSVGLAQSAASIGTMGVVFSAIVSGGNVLVQYTTTSTGTGVTMKYRQRRWA